MVGRRDLARSDAPSRSRHSPPGAPGGRREAGRPGAQRSVRVADVFSPTGTHDAVVRIEISVRGGPPPSGSVSVDAGPLRSFESWLGLLRILEDAVSSEPPAAPPGRLGGELAAGGDSDLGERV
jgi:hypothetical protein